MIVLPAYAKVNLSLDVLHKRADGYHEVAMVMQSIGLADELVLEEAPEDILLTVNTPDLACDSANLAYRAAELVRNRLDIKKGVKISLAKKIPMAAGLAGGSADAAAVLRGLNLLWGLGLSQQEMEMLGAKLGSDIPFCLRGGTVLATGRGEVLQSLPALPPCYVVLAKPRISVSTAWVYGQYRVDGEQGRPDTHGLLACLRQGDVSGIASRLCNVLESVTIAAFPQIADLKQQMVQGGALNSIMSGSGPTVFGLVDDSSRAMDIAREIQSRSQDSVEVFVAKTIAGVE